ncbi:MAG: signal peptide peptidase SppA [Methylomonas sp.]
MDNEQENPTTEPVKPEWERKVLEQLAFAALNEQKTTRRWGVFFKLLAFSYFVALLLIVAYPNFESEMSSNGQHTAVVDVLGMIAEGESANAHAIITGLRNAASNKNTKGIILNINSPGGSPVQAADVYDEIKRLKTLHPDLPIYSVVGDICASGGYYIAAASDKIFVNQASLIGSIGVVMNGFGFTHVLEKLGIERRLLTAGEHKAMLDPFLPVKSQETKHMQSLLDQVHQQFIRAVRDGRGQRLKETEAPEMFSGLVWTGSEGVRLGLADGFGSVDSVSREVFGVEDQVNFTPQEHLMDRLAGKFGTAFGHSVTTLLPSAQVQ